MLTEREYPFPVYSTRNKGLVRWVDGAYVFVEKPDFSGLEVGDEMPTEWDVAPANALAQQAQQAQEEAEEFSRGLEEFFDLLFDKAERGEMTYEQIERFFPPEIGDR